MFSFRKNYLIIFYLFSVAVIYGGSLDQLRSKAEKGDYDAMFSLGDEFFFGSEKTKRNYTLAAYWYHKASEGGIADAMFNYGVCLDRGLGVEQDRIEAFQWYKKAADHGSFYGKYNVAEILLSGIPADEIRKKEGIAASPGLALHYLKELSGERFELAEVLLAELLLEQRDNAESVASAVEILHRLAENKNKNPKVLRMLADCRYAGLGMKKDHKEMIRLLQEAVDLGDAEAAGKLAYCFEYGRGIPADEKKAFDLYRIGAELGNSMSQFKYAEFLISGRPAGNEPELEKALIWYEKGAKAGNPQAIFRMGVFFLEGMGRIEKDAGKAAKYFFQAAKMGYPQAQYNLACMLSSGEGGLLKDDAAALFWFLQAAKQGDAPSARNIGLRYLEGKGVSRSITKAESWLKIAADAGDFEADRILRTRFR